MGPNQDVLTQKEFVPGGVQLTQKLEPVWSTDQRLREGIYSRRERETIIIRGNPMMDESD